MSAAYVEFLRVTRALRVVAILIALILLGALVLRFSFGAPATTHAVARDYYAGLEHSPTAHVTRTRLRGGITRTIVDDPKKEVYAIIDRRGSAVVSFTFAHTKEAAEDQSREAAARSTTDTSHGVQYGYVVSIVGEVFSLTLPMGLLVSTLLGGPLSKENNGHLEVAWTKPVSRSRYALATVVFDIAGTVIAQVLTGIAVLIAFCYWGVPKIAFEAGALAWFALILAVPIAWYALITALSASLKRGPGVMLGIGWALVVVVPWIAAATQDATTALGRTVHALFSAANYLLPPSYLWGNLGARPDTPRQIELGLAAVTTLAVVYLGLALLQWRRVEA